MEPIPPPEFERPHVLDLRAPASGGMTRLIPPESVHMMPTLILPQTPGLMAAQPVYPHPGFIRPGKPITNPNLTAAHGPQARQMDQKLPRSWHTNTYNATPAATNQSMDEIHRNSEYAHGKVQNWLRDQNPGLPRNTTFRMLPVPVPNADPSATRSNIQMPQQSTQQSRGPPTPAGLDPELKEFINHSIPQLYSSYLIVQAPVDQNGPEGVQKRQRALAWIDEFKAKLTPAGHEYLNKHFTKEMEERLKEERSRR